MLLSSFFHFSCLFLFTTPSNGAQNEGTVYHLLHQNGKKALHLISPDFLRNGIIFGCPLICYAAQGDFGDGVVEELLALGTSATVSNPNFPPPLFKAISRKGCSRYGDGVPSAIRTIKALLDAGAQVSTRYRGENALHEACYGNTHPAVFEFVLQHSLKLIETESEPNGYTPLDRCAARNEKEKVRSLLRAGAKPSIKRAIFGALSSGNSIRLMIERAREIWSQCRNEVMTLAQSPALWIGIEDPFKALILPHLSYIERVKDIDFNKQ